MDEEKLLAEAMITFGLLPFIIVFMKLIDILTGGSMIAYLGFWGFVLICSTIAGLLAKMIVDV